MPRVPAGADQAQHGDPGTPQVNIDDWTDLEQWPQIVHSLTGAIAVAVNGHGATDAHIDVDSIAVEEPRTQPVFVGRKISPR